jgi:hypothetical protein
MRYLLWLVLLYAAGISWLYVFQAYPRHRVETGWLIVASVFLATAVARFTRTSAGGSAGVGVRAVLIAIGAALLLYLPSIGVGFLSDDYTLLAMAKRGEFVSSGWEHFRPFSLMVWAALNLAGLTSAPVLHGVNIALHGVNAYFTYLIAREAGGSSRAAVAAGCLFLVFPGSVEPVTWISGFQEVLMVTLVLAFLLSALRSRVVMAFVLLGLATFTKETAVCAPVLLALLSVRRRVDMRLLAGAFVWCAVFAVLRLVIKPAGDLAAPVTGYFVKELIVRIFGGLALPWTRDQVFAHPWAMSSLLVSIATLLALLASRMRDRQLWTAALIFAAWSLVAALPVYRYLYISPELQGSRHMYLPSVGWALLLAFLAYEIPGRLPRIAGGVLVVLGLAGVTMQQLRWRSAAEHREAVLAGASAEVQAAGCTNAEFRNGPDSHAGVYVFRNGIREATEARGLANPAAPRDCAFEWRNDRFVRVAVR